MTLYPSEIDTVISLPQITNLVTPISAESINRLRDAVIAIEAELGVKPSGTYTTVRHRLDSLEAALGASGVFLAANDLSGTSTSQNVIAISGSDNKAPIKCTTLEFKKELSQAIIRIEPTTETGTIDLTIRSQDLDNDGGSGGDLILSSGSGNDYGDVKIQSGGNDILSITESGERIVLKNIETHQSALEESHGKIIDVLKGVFTSNNDTPVEMYSYFFNTDGLILADAIFTGVSENGSVAYKRSKAFRCVSGTVTEIGSIHLSQTDEDPTECTSDITASGNFIQFMATGPNETMTWVLSARIQLVKLFVI